MNSYEKKELIEYIYKNIDIYQIRFCMIKNISHAHVLKQYKHHVSPHYNGYNYLLIIKKILDGSTNVYLVYRMDLKFNKAELNYNNISIFKLNINPLYNHILEQYDSTIIDGKVVTDVTKEIFIINDIYYLKGSKLLINKIEEKFRRIELDLINLNNLLNLNFEIKIIELYNYNDMNNLVYDYIHKTKFAMNGLIFIPNRTGKILLYVNEPEFNDIKKNYYTYEKKNNIKQINIVDVDVDVDQHQQNLLLLKTKIIDVYEVYTIDKSNRYGIASVPSMEMSHKLRKHFNNNDKLIIKCIYDTHFLKWKPLI